MSSGAGLLTPRKVNAYEANKERRKDKQTISQAGKCTKTLMGRQKDKIFYEEWNINRWRWWMSPCPGYTILSMIIKQVASSSAQSKYYSLGSDVLWASHWCSKLASTPDTYAKGKRERYIRAREWQNQPRVCGERRRRRRRRQQRRRDTDDQKYKSSSLMVYMLYNKTETRG